jgi:hypothetical protein
VYYPRENQQGVVNNPSFMDASSGQNAGWTCASERGEEAFQRLLAEAATQPYLVLTQDDGTLIIADPQSLEQIAELDSGVINPSRVRAEAGGMALQYQSNVGDLSQQFALNLESRSQCFDESGSTTASPDEQVVESNDGRWMAVVSQSSDRTVVDLQSFAGWSFDPIRFPRSMAETYSGAWDAEGTYFYLTDSETIYRFELFHDGRMRESGLTLPEGAGDSMPLEFAGAVGYTLYLYHPIGNQQEATEGQDEAVGGIFVVNAVTGEMSDHLQPEVSFEDVILNGDTLYGVQSQGAGDAQVYALSRLDGTLIAETTLDESVGDTAYVRLNPELLTSDTSSVQVENCAEVADSPFLIEQVAAAS